MLGPSKYMSATTLDRFKAVVVMLVFMLPTFLYLAITSEPDWVKLFPDDAFYYLQIAWNTFNASSVSFDGVNTTNGFHPLQWGFMVVAAMTKSKSMMMQVAIVQNALLVVLSALCVARYVLKD